MPGAMLKKIKELGAISRAEFLLPNLESLIRGLLGEQHFARAYTCSSK